MVRVNGIAQARVCASCQQGGLAYCGSYRTTGGCGCTVSSARALLGTLLGTYSKAGWLFFYRLFLPGNVCPELVQHVFADHDAGVNKCVPSTGEGNHITTGSYECDANTPSQQYKSDEFKSFCP